ncbi:Triose-phosphate Transporter [Linnemannia schmuckeri]|uniref:Triose-phosphate Transporter n=1 Tax=Linnemannia schmuckeri TaxID=64567 RepID=A0A9P5VCY5_9FUNG|nr:Triose-phosphate Transporter [Linnemannia schmuckeri]
MRDSRETTLARRQSQQIPKSVPSPPQNHPISSPQSPSTSEKSFRRISQHVGSSPLQPALDATANRKKNEDDNHDAALIGVNSGLAAGAMASSTPPPLALTGVSINQGSNNANAPSSPVAHSLNHLGHSSTPPVSSGSGAGASARTPLGTVLASTFGHNTSSGPGSPTVNTGRPFKYSSGSSTNQLFTSNSTADPKFGGPIRKSSLPTEKETGSGGGSSFSNYAPSVFINIGGTSSSLPQIVMPKKRIAQNVASNFSYILAWYFFSTALSIYNKNLMGKDNWNFNLPLFVSSIHAGLHFVITACLMHFWPDIFDATRSGKGGRITIHSYVTQVVPCAVAAALEICMANASLMYITLSFYTMIKSSTPIWVLMFAFIFRLEKPRLSLILIIGVIVVGVVLTVAGETQFDMTGFVLVLLAAVMSGLRWSLTQMLLQKDQLGMDNPVATLYYISPIMFILMSILSLVIEDPFVQFSSSAFFQDFRTGALTLVMAGGGGFLAFAMTVAEFKLIKNTGTVTLSVAGISKEIVVISLSMLIFGDRLTFVNLLGLLVSIGGIMAYNYVKIRKMQQSLSSSGDYEVLARHHKGDNTD